MNTIKFRAWDNKFKMMNEVLVMDFDSQKVNLHPDYNHQSYFRDIIIMQYTGLTDKNNKEIFEGDIINYLTNRNENGSYGSNFRFLKENAKAVFFEDGIFKCDGYVSLYDCIRPLRYGDKPYYEVIGNIYENPELIKL